jgi:hypothetical protein
LPSRDQTGIAQEIEHVVFVRLGHRREVIRL